MTTILKTAIVALALYCGLYFACLTVAKNATASVVNCTYGQLASVGR